MAQTNKVAVEIVAIDEASPKIDKLTKKIDGLESDEARVIITSNINRLEEQLDAAQKKLDSLDGDQATVQARLVGNLESDLEQANKLFDQLNGETGTVTINTAGATEGVRDLGKTADSSKNALANMVGNTTQDLGQFSGVAGSAGVALGQMAEFASDAAFAGEGLTVALKNMALVAGPIAALAIGTQLLGKFIADAKAREEELRDAIKEVTQEFIKAQDAGEDFTTTLGKLAGSKADEFLEELGSKTGDVQDAFALLRIDYADLVQAFTTGKGPIVDAINRLHDFENATRGVPLDQLTAAEEQWAEQHGVSADRMHAELDALRLLDDELKDNVDLQKAATAEARRTAAFRAGAATTEQEVIDNAIAEARALDQQRVSRAAANAELERYLQLLEGRHDEAEQQQRNADATDRYTDAIARLNTEEERVDRARHLKEEETNARALISIYDELTGKLSAEGRKLALVAAFERAKEQIAEGNLSLVEAGVLLNNLKQDAARYGQELKLPKEQIVPIIAEIDTLALDKAQSDLLGLTSPITVPVVPQWAQGSLPGLPSFLRAPTTTPSTPVGNVTINNPPGTPAATVDQFNIFVTRNGDRTQL